jgi:SAM-dependent methyltransferase
MADEYTLQLSEPERARYRAMAQWAVEDEAHLWTSAGIVPGAVVADVGCGPGATLARLAEAVAPGGRADGVDGNTGTVAAAAEETAALEGVTTRVGQADATGLEAGAYDVAMCRHVLAHNGGREAAIVEHLVALARPGGAVYLVDVDLTAFRQMPAADPALVLAERYADFHASRGNDPLVGLRMGHLLEAAGCTVERFQAIGRVVQLPVGVRPPWWAAREAMVASGLVTVDDVARTEAVLDRIDATGESPWLALAAYVAIGRVPG